MTGPKKPTPQAVSAFLRQEFHRYSKGRPVRHEGGWVPVYPGFKVEDGYGPRGKVEHVAVRYVLGSRNEKELTPEEQAEKVRERLNAYREHLSERYRVTTEPDEDGSWDTLLVWVKA